MTAAKRKRMKMRRAGIDRLNFDNDVLGMYLADINRIPLLSRAEEDLAAQAAASGDTAARNKLINSNLRFVITVAKKYQGRGIPLEDLINEGNIGLINAVERFDSGRGYHFISYAVWWIRQSILQALYEKSRFIRLPANQTNNLIHIENAKKRFNDNSGAENKIQEIAQLLNIKESYIADIMAISREVVSLENMIDTGTGIITLGNTVEDDRYDTPDNAAMKKLLENDIEELLHTLDSKEAEVIRLHFGLGERMPMTLQEIGIRFNLSKERVRQIKEKAIRRLQNISRKTKLEAYVA